MPLVVADLTVQARGGLGAVSLTAGLGMIKVIIPFLGISSPFMRMSVLMTIVNLQTVSQSQGVSGRVI